MKLKDYNFGAISIKTMSDEQLLTWVKNSDTRPTSFIYDRQKSIANKEIKRRKLN